MTASENPPTLTTVDRLEGLYGLTSADLGLDEAAFTRRVALWEQLAAEQGGTARQQQARVRVTALTNTITALMRRADKFRAEGDITTERDILGRVEVFQGWLTAAVAEADPTSPSSSGPRSASPAAEFTGYGIGGEWVTFIDDPELAALRAEAGQEIQANAGLMFRHKGTFTRSQNGRTREYPCRFSVRDPVKGSRDQVAAAEAFATAAGAAFRDVRVLTVHPDDARPPEGAVLTTPWDGGRLEVRSWSQPSDFTGQAIGLCLLRR